MREKNEIVQMWELQVSNSPKGEKKCIKLAKSSE